MFVIVFMVCVYKCVVISWQLWKAEQQAGEPVGLKWSLRRQGAVGMLRHSFKIMYGDRMLILINYAYFWY